MPYELYWRGPLGAFLIYAEKARLEAERYNYRSWLDGRYTREALQSVYHLFNPMLRAEAPKHPYPSEPFKPPKPVSKEQEQRRQEMTDAILKHNQKIREMLGR
jgi:hypothetical protein